MEESRIDPAQQTEFNAADFYKEHLSRTADGKYEIVGDDLSSVELALLDTEKRRRGSQAAASRERARADRAELEVNKIQELIPQVQHPVTDVDESLKYTDPDAYIEQRLQAQSADPYAKAFDTARTQATEEATQRTVESEILAFNADNPDKQITMEMLDLDLPPRLINEFSQGNLAPQEFLGRAADLLYRPTETHNQPTLNQPNLGNVGGQTTPTDDGSNDKMLENYSQAIF